MISENRNKTALVTGSAKRVGRAIALALAADGWKIALHYNSTDVSEVATECQKLGARTVTIKADLNDFTELQTVLPKANAALGEVTLLINNASIFEKCSFADTSEDVFDRHMNINFKAPLFLAQAFAKQCSGGQIINISDARVTDNKTAYYAYLQSKKALSDSTKMLAVELAPKILVNEICIGTTELYDNLDQKHLDEKVNRLPLRHKTTLAEICETILHLNKSSYLTGQSIFLDAGEQLI